MGKLDSRWVVAIIVLTCWGILLIAGVILGIISIIERLRKRRDAERGVTVAYHLTNNDISEGGFEVNLSGDPVYRVQTPPAIDDEIPGPSRILDEEHKCALCNEKGELSQVRSAGANTLCDYLRILGEFSTLEVVRQRFSEKRLFVHEICRTAVRNAYNKHVKESKEANAGPRRSSKRKRGANEQISDQNTKECSRPKLMYKNRCIICLKLIETDPKHPDRSRGKYRTVSTLEVKLTLEKMCLDRNDEDSMEVYGRLQGLSDLVAEEAKYCINCRRELARLPRPREVGRPLDQDKERAFDLVCQWIETNAESGIFTLPYLHDKLVSFVNEIEGIEAYSRRWLKEKLLNKYADTIYFSNEERKCEVLCFKDKCGDILRAYVKKEDVSLEQQKLDLLTAAAKVLKNDIKTMTIEGKSYPTASAMAQEYTIPESLEHFLDSLLNSKNICNFWAQNVVSMLRPRSGPMPGQLGLALMLDHKYGSKLLIQKLHKLGYCSSYSEVLRYKWSYIKYKHDTKLESIPEGESEVVPTALSDSEDDENEAEITSMCPSVSSNSTADSEISFEDPMNELEEVSVLDEVENIIADNLDMAIRSMYGNTSFHGMGRMKVTTPKPKDAEEPVFTRANFRPGEKSTLINDFGIKVRPYYPLKANGLGSITFRPFLELQNKFIYNTACLLDVAFSVSWLIDMGSGSNFRPVNWKGFMKSVHRPNIRARSHIEFLQIIDQPPDSYATVYTTLVECLKLSKSKPMVITFDLPLWLKANRIVLERGMPIVVRLGGFHILKSFIGCVGYIMTDSGLEELVKLIFPGDVAHIMDGGSYYKALRSHFLIDSALCCYLMEDNLTSDELRKLEDYINKCVNEKLGVNYRDKTIEDLSTKMEQTFSKLSSCSRTASLWATYHGFVAIIKDYIRAERMHDFSMHLAIIAKMLPIFAAAGRGQYAKGLRLYLEQMAVFEVKYGALINTFKVVGLHTVRYTDHEWSGVWTDMSIEQLLMLAAKSPGGLTGGRMRRQETHMLWTGTFDQMALINQSMDDAINGLSKQRKSGAPVLHPDLLKSAIKKNIDCFAKLLDWFKETVDLSESDNLTKLISYTTGLISDTQKDNINPDECISVGTTLQKELDGMTFVDKIRLKGKVQNLSQLKKPVKINNKSVVIDSLKLFNRLVLVSDRDSTIEESLKFELTVMPLSLFDQAQLMRKANKAAFGKVLKDKCNSNACSRSSLNPLIIDGGWLLYQLSSFQGCQDFGAVALEYLKLIPKNREVVVIFDGYAPSTKDHEHARRVKNYCSDIVIKKTTYTCTVTMKKLLSNKNNKTELIKLLSTVFMENGVDAHQADDDADTVIVRKVLDMALHHIIELKAEDTDILCLLIYHFNSDHHKDILMTTKSGSFSIREIVTNLDQRERDILLLVHSISGCDTVSGIYGFSKESLLKKAVIFNEHGDLAPLLSVRVSKNDIIRTGLNLFQHFYGDKGKSLENLRYLNYNRMVAKTKLNPSRLPPTSNSATEHILRSYLQYHNWAMLDTRSLDPEEYGWEKDSDGHYSPVATKGAIAPDSILNLICCNCSINVEQPCQSQRCSCRRFGFNCLPACGQCHGAGCTNSPERKEPIEDTE